jgi:hypothetical protein
MLATGHKTEAVFKSYSGHALESDLMDVAVTTGEVFGGLVPEISIPDFPQGIFYRDFLECPGLDRAGF